MKIRQASIAEAAAVLAQIEEFAYPADEAGLQSRLQGHRSLILIAEIEGQPVGIKIGYALSETCFYSWLGGVTAEARGYGVAQALLTAQETWMREQGYVEVRVKSRNRFSAMLRLLLRNGYQIEHLEKKDGLADYRLHFIKDLFISEG
ncbi:GNAT family N-acetyltransferase [Photobacterium atrarenae]|uniref:GNAT family N-acetyltransferase n=1 Tax=Photobacterium atrarenae TaxID=865757 RepID=A0ABY5GEY2_9GAMM|nr:GNAT family N-acetyltransferase [Photobacterium atrarenae]UTV27660.1 GNAT family N-acetyltransferase [Photobacterium atrarenae]